MGSFSHHIVLFLVLIPFHVGQAQRCACTEDSAKCASIHETPTDFESARLKCRKLGGEIMRAGTALSNDTIAALLNNTRGFFWAELETEGDPRCLSVSSGSKWTENTCVGKLNGFICGGVRWDTTCWKKMASKVIILNYGDCIMAPCDYHCEHVRNGYTCTCMEQFRPAKEDPRRCEYFCLTTTCNPLCDSGSCWCPRGFVMDGDRCTDIDECHSNHNCEQTCTNTIGGYNCSCTDGYKLVNSYGCAHTHAVSDKPGLPPPTAPGGLFITPALNYTSGRVVVASPGEYVGITVFVIAALIGAVFLVRYLRTRKTEERLKDCDVLDNNQQQAL